MVQTLGHYLDALFADDACTPEGCSEALSELQLALERPLEQARRQKPAARRNRSLQVALLVLLGLSLLLGLWLGLGPEGRARTPRSGLRDRLQSLLIGRM